MDPWLERLGNLRNVVRQEMVGRQLGEHLGAHPLRVLDVGAGQGTQAVRLAAAGHHVTAVEPDGRMREAFATYAAGLAEPADIRLLPGDLQTLGAVLGDDALFDAVLCHGVLMYLPDASDAVARLAARVAPNGFLSLVARNGPTMAWRPSIRGDWPAALTMLDEIQAASAQGRDARYVNEIGVPARADSLDSLTAHCDAAGLRVEAWYGIRVASDGVPVDAPTPPPDELTLILDVEERLGRTDPYRALGTLLHVIARRP